jgi:hypothetical protein
MAAYRFPVHAWTPLGAVALAGLCEARTTLHWAARVAASVGATHGEPKDDDSHTALRWWTEASALVGRQVRGGYRAGLRVRDLTVFVLDPADRVATEHSLVGLRFREAMQWLEGELARLFGEVEPVPLVEPQSHTLAPHPIGQGAVFAIDSPESTAEIAAWYANAHAFLEAVAEAEPGAAEVRCWPHHFDIATTLPIAGDQGEPPRSIGVGMSPGDGSYDVPYWFVTPWPYPESPTLPPLAAGGHWHTEGWTGAVLPGTLLAADDPHQSQPERLAAFLESAIAANRGLVLR